MSNLVLQWFRNLRQDIVNNEIILLYFKNKDSFSKFKDDDSFKNINTLLVKFIKNLIIVEDLTNKDRKNIILVSDKNCGIGFLDIFKNYKVKLLFIPIINYLNFKDLELQINSSRIQNYYSLEIRDPIINIDNISYIEYFISTFMENSDLYGVNFFSKSIEFYLFRNQKSISKNTILNDISYLKQTGILTSRLAIFIFKICTFYINASDREIGIYYAKLFGRSKVYNNKKLGISNVKGYVTSYYQNDIVYNTKIDIAKYLLSYNCCSIDLLSNATGLSLETLNGLKNV